MDIRYSNRVFADIESLKEEGDLFLIDSKVMELYKEEVLKTIKAEDIISFQSLEENKTIEHLLGLIDELLARAMERSNKLFIIGGGVLGDLGGFAASIYKRGIDYIQIPTSLLAQVDSSIGGKTGLDYRGYKNILGSFHFPKITLIDPIFLSTLSKRDIISGMGEIVKYGLLSDYPMLLDIEENLEGILETRLDIIEKYIPRSIAIKDKIVKEDKLESDIRKTLNLGHTLGHGIESFYEYKKYKHGEAILIGLYYESKLAHRRALITDEYFHKIEGILVSLIEIPSFNLEEIESIYAYMKQDKKNLEGNISFILPIAEAKVAEFMDLTFEEIEEVLRWKDDNKK